MYLHQLFLHTGTKLQSMQAWKASTPSFRPHYLSISSSDMDLCKDKPCLQFSIHALFDPVSFEIYALWFLNSNQHIRWVQPRIAAEFLKSMDSLGLSDLRTTPDGEQRPSFIELDHESDALEKLQSLVARGLCSSDVTLVLDLDDDLMDQLALLDKPMETLVREALELEISNFQKKISHSLTALDWKLQSRYGQVDFFDDLGLIVQGRCPTSWAGLDTYKLQLAIEQSPGISSLHFQTRQRLDGMFYFFTDDAGRMIFSWSSPRNLN